MAATIYVAESYRTNSSANANGQTVWLDDTAVYWRLYRYFEAANLDRRHELVDLYGGAEIDGYQLDRLEDELLAAREDAERRPDQWKILTSWNNTPSRENEIWQTVGKPELLKTISELLVLINLARTMNLKLIVSGD